jgi:hypothetical protein
LELSGEHTPRRRDPLGAFAEATMDRIVLKTAKTHKYQNGGFEIGGWQESLESNFLHRSDE